MDASFLANEVRNLQPILSKNLEPDTARKILLDSFCRIYYNQTGTETFPNAIPGGPTSIAWGLFQNQFGNLSSMSSIRACAGAIAGDLVREFDRINIAGTGYGDPSAAKNVRDNLMAMVTDPDMVPGKAPTRVGRGVDANTLAQTSSPGIFTLIGNMENTRLQAEAARQPQPPQQTLASLASAPQSPPPATPSTASPFISDKVAGIGTLCAGALLVGGVPLLVGLAALHLIASSRTTVLDDSAKVVGSGTKIVANALLEAAGISGVDDVKQRLGGLASRLGLSRAEPPQPPQPPSGPRI